MEPIHEGFLDIFDIKKLKSIKKIELSFGTLTT